MNLLLPVIVLLAAILLLVIAGRDANGNNQTEYDERQQMIMRKSAQRTLVTGIILNMIFSLIFSCNHNLPFDASFILAAIALVSLLVYTIPCILTGSYFGIRNKWKSTAVTSAFIAVIDLISGSMQTGTDLKTDKILTLGNSITLMVGITFAIITISVIAAAVIERKEAE